MIIFIIEIDKLIQRRMKMNFRGKQMNVFNAGVMLFIVLSVAMTIRHLSMVIASFFIWFHDRKNVFAISTLEEQFSICLGQSSRF